MNLQTYVNSNNLARETRLLREVIIGNKLRIIGNSNSHDYNRYADENGYIRLNNPKMNVSSGESLSNGLIDSRGRIMGNTIMFSDLEIYTNITKLEIIKKLENISNEIKKLKEQEVYFKEQLKYMNDNNITSLGVEEYENILTERIVKKE